MQTGLQLFDLSAKATPVKSQKPATAASKQTRDEKSVPMDGFAQIMSALLALPTEQWKNNLSDLDGTNLDAMTPGGDSELLTSQFETDDMDASLAQLLELILNMKGVTPQEFQSAGVEDNPQLLLDMAKAFLQDPQQFTSILEKGKGDLLKAQLMGQGDPKAATSQGENAIEEVAQLVLENAGENPLVPGMGQGQEKRKKLHGDAKKPFDDVSFALKESSPDKTASKGPQPSNQVKDSLFKTSGPSPDGMSNRRDPVNAKATLSTRISNPLAAESMPDKEGKAIDKEPASLSVADVQNAALETASDIGGNHPEEHLFQKSASPAGGHQGILSRIEARQDPLSVPISDDKAVMQQDKATQADVIRQIVQRMSMHTQGSQSKMVIRLKPEFLGNVQMHVVTENHQVTVRMMAESTLVKDIVEQNLQHLRTELLHHGLEIQKFDVFVANDDQGWRNGQDKAGFGDNMNQKQSRSGGGKAKQQRGKVMLDVRNTKPSNQKDPNEIDYFV